MQCHKPHFLRKDWGSKPREYVQASTELLYWRGELYLCFVSLDRVLLCSSGRPGILHIDLELLFSLPQPPNYTRLSGRF